MFEASLTIWRLAVPIIMGAHALCQVANAASSQAFDQVLGRLDQVIELPHRGALQLASRPQVFWAAGLRGEFSYEGLVELTWQPYDFPVARSDNSAPKWYRFMLRNSTSEARHLTLDSQEGVLAEFVVLHISRLGMPLESYYSGIGLEVPSYRRFLQTHDEFYFTLAPGETAEFTLGIQSSTGGPLLYQLVPESEHNDFHQLLNVFFGLRFGVGFLAILMALVSAALVRESANLAFAVMLLGELTAEFIGLGYPKVFLGPFAFAAMKSSFFPIVMMALVFRTWFVRDFLAVKRHSKILSGVLNLMMVMGLLLVALLSNPALRQPAMIGFTIYCAVVFMITFIGAAYWGVRERNWVYLSFAISSLVVMGGGGLWYMAFSGQWVPSFWMLNAFRVTSVLEWAVVAAGFFERVLRFRQGAMSAHEKQLEAQRLGLFIKVLNHDIANYVGIIRGAGDLIRHSDGNQDVSKLMADRIVNAANLQRDVIASVKRLLAVDELKANLPLSRVPIMECLEEIRELMEQKIAKKKLELTIRSELPSDTCVMAERSTLVSSVLMNIMVNAAKFSFDGGKILVLVTERPSSIDVCIRDYGMGMPQAVLDGLFDPIATVSRTGTAGEKGTGFGMCICRTFMDIFGGEINVHSSVNSSIEQERGTSVILTFRKS